MEFIKVGKNYMIKNSNGRIISEKEKLKLETNELIIENEKCGCSCPDKIKKITKNKKKIKEIENNEKIIETKIYRNPYNENIIKDELIVDKKGNKKVKRTALNNEVQDEIIKETDTII